MSKLPVSPGVDEPVLVDGRASPPNPFGKAFLAIPSSYRNPQSTAGRWRVNHVRAYPCARQCVRQYLPRMP